jgi:hypothetical protein
MSFYSNLASYNNYGAQSCESIKAPCSAMAIQTVPVYSPPGYETFSGSMCGQGHLGIMEAYGQTCDKFAARLCDCNLPGSKGGMCAGPMGGCGGKTGVQPKSGTMMPRGYGMNMW